MQGLSWGIKESLVGACGIQFLYWGSDPGPLRWVCSGVLATEEPRKSQQLKFFFFQMRNQSMEVGKQGLPQEACGHSVEN